MGRKLVLAPGPGMCLCRKHDLVVAGQYDRQSQDNIQILKIAKIFIHPHYNPLNNYADLALLKLTSQADFHLTVVSPVLLPSVDDKFHVRSSCRVMGWGVTRFNRTIMPIKLQEATVYLQTNEVCRKYWGPNLPQEMICVGAKGISPYDGDSGGSLVCMKYGVWTLVGILTCVDETRPTDVPVVAVRIPKFIPWIEDIVAHN
ncbi:chymotrypsinogen B2-like [Talpa occidentalis]|uniref:chymotrypsinogen B2-like n=1 Tax=Talpa occidentalis TaxID=50954 RepID=UPI00188E780E|nr:chymotrypsinogen B2-like [Talpa occidentalis]